MHGIPKVRNESTYQLINAVAKSLNVQLSDNHISTSHRLSQSDETTAAG